MDREREAQTRQWMHKLFKIIGITVAALIIGAAVFFVFKLQADAKAVLREAKNTRMALQSADIEMYAKGKSVFNPSNENGIENGVTGLVNQIYKPEGTYRSTGYDAKRHEVTGMTYENGHFLVTYQLKGDAIYWDVDYRMNVYHYDDDDIVVR